MAKIGLNNFRYGKLTELENGSFSYADAKSPGKAVSCNVSVSNNTATLYADDELAESYTGYQNATVSITIDEEDIETYSDLLGHTITDEGEVVANSNDVAPYIGFGRIITKMVKGVIKYKVQFLYKAKFTEPSKEENTKGESIEFGTYALEGGVYTLQTDAGQRIKHSREKRTLSHISTASLNLSRYTTVQLLIFPTLLLLQV